MNDSIKKLRRDKRKKEWIEEWQEKDQAFWVGRIKSKYSIRRKRKWRICSYSTVPSYFDALYSEACDCNMYWDSTENFWTVNTTSITCLSSSSKSFLVLAKKKVAKYVFYLRLSIFLSYLSVFPCVRPESRWTDFYEIRHRRVLLNFIDR
jgi:hypothetical protein